jgi:hypothetical protein
LGFVPMALWPKVAWPTEPTDRTTLSTPTHPRRLHRRYLHRHGGTGLRSKRRLALLDPWCLHSVVAPGRTRNRRSIVRVPARRSASRPRPLGVGRARPALRSR